MGLYAIKHGNDGDLVRARSVRPEFPLSDEFLTDLSESLDFDTFRVGSGNTVRPETAAERTTRLRKPTPAEEAEREARRDGFSRKLVKALAVRFGVTEDQMRREIRDA